MTTICPDALYRLRSVCRSKDGPGFVDVSPQQCLRGVRTGRYPAPVRDHGSVFWRGRDLLTFIEGLANVGKPPGNQETHTANAG